MELRRRRPLALLTVASAAVLAVIASAGLVLASNAAPTAYDQTFTTGGEPIEITLYAQDPDGDRLTYLVLSEPQKGTLSGTAPSFLYSPSAAFDGSDSFTWKASDESSDSNVATVSIGSASQEQSAATALTPTQTTSTVVAFRSSSAASTGDALPTTLSVPRPSGIVAGDLMLLHISTVRPHVSQTNSGFTDPRVCDRLTNQEDVIPGVLTSSRCTGQWTLVQDLKNDVGLTVRSYVYKKVATASDETRPHYSIDFGVATQAAVGIGAWSGACTSATSEATAVGTSVTVPGVDGRSGGRIGGFFATFGYLGRSQDVVTSPASRKWYTYTRGLVEPTRSVTVGTDEAVIGSGGKTPARTVTSPRPAVWIGQLVSLKPC